MEANTLPYSANQRRIHRIMNWEASFLKMNLGPSPTNIEGVVILQRSRPSHRTRMKENSYFQISLLENIPNVCLEGASVREAVIWHWRDNLLSEHPLARTPHILLKRVASEFWLIETLLRCAIIPPLYDKPRLSWLISTSRDCCVCLLPH